MAWALVSHGVGFHVWVLVSRFGLDRFRDRPPPGPPKISLFCAQLALDTTMVSPLHRDGTAKRGTSFRGGAVLQEARRTYPELNGARGRARLVVLAAEVGGRWSDETAQFLRALPNTAPREFQVSCVSGCNPRG